MYRSVTDDHFFNNLPKVELHRHLEGSLRLDTLLDVARTHRLDLADTMLLRSLVEINDEEPFTFENFLSKFKTLRLFYRTPEIIGRITREAILDAAQDNVRYLELRFTPVALSQSQGFSLAEVMDWVIEGTVEARKAIENNEKGIATSLIVSLNRHESRHLAEKIVTLALDRRESGITGLDLAGNEAHFPGLPFAELFRDARKAGLHTTVHAGEWGGAENVKEAILHHEAERIGHGIRVMDEPAVVGLARERGITFEVCVTSNYQSGVVPVLSDHPLRRMISAGLNVTLNTDDPSVSKINLAHEYRIAHQVLDLEMESLHKLVLAGGEAAFLPEKERQHLIQVLEKELWECSTSA